MKQIRLLPIVLFATTALLALKILTFVTGTGSFAVGPTAAVAAATGGHGGGEEANPITEPQGNFEDPLDFEPPLDLAKEAEELAKKPEAAAGGHGAAAEGGHGAPAEGGHGETPPAEGEHGAPAEGGHGETPPAEGDHAAPADAAHGETPPAEGDHAAPADAAHGETPPAEGDHAAPADAAHGETPPAEGDKAPADGAHGDAPPADAHAAPAADAHGAPAGGHGAPALPKGVSTERPEEYKPEPPKTEAAILDALSQRRQQLDKREADIELRMKLLDATEKRLQDRVDELKSIQNQIGVVNGGGAAPGADGKAPDGSGGTSDASQLDPQTKNLVSMYETMKPKAAAAVFDSLDLPVLLPLVKNMNPRKMAPILAAMDPEKAGRLTAALTALAMRQPVVVRLDNGNGNVSPLMTPPAAPSAAELPKIMPADPSGGG